MPFDALPDPALARLPEVRPRLRPEPMPPPAVLPPRVAKTRKAVVVLRELEKLFNDGENWLQNAYHDGDGNHCLVGGLECIRARRGAGDNTGVYVVHAIGRVTGKRTPIIEYNDRRMGGYAEIQAIIRLAATLAQRVVDGYATQGQLKLVLGSPGPAF
jgi:hypothetical protein